jgi:ABC-2 type transport system permease protein
LVNQFRRDWWRLVFVALGALWSISIVPALVVGSSELSKTSFDVKQSALVALSAFLALAWVLVPLLATGVDDSLDPSRFAPWGLGSKRLMPGLTVAAFTTIPAILFVGVALVMAASWRGGDKQATVLVVAFIGAVLTALTWVFSARVATLWAVRLLTTRAAKGVVSASVAVLGAVVAGAIIRVRAEGLASLLENEIATALTQLGRTPIGAAMAAPASIVEGNVWGAVWRLAMVAAWVVVLHFAWRDAVSYVLVHPTARGAGVRRNRDAILASGERTGRPWSLVRPVTRVVLSRTARSWRTDPRYVTQIVGALVFPVMIGGLILSFSGNSNVWMAALPVALGITIGWGRHNDLAFDSSGSWLDIVSGVRGADILVGRLLGVVLWAGPALIVLSVAAAGVAGRWDVFPAVAATALGTLGMALGVASITSVLMPYRVPAPGESPFGADAGSIGASLLGQVVSSVGTGVAVPFIVAPLVCAFLWGGAWWAVAIVWGPLAGGVLAWWGTSLGGRWYDSRSGRLLGAVG